MALINLAKKACLTPRFAEKQPMIVALLSLKIPPQPANPEDLLEALSVLHFIQPGRGGIPNHFFD